MVPEGWRKVRFDEALSLEYGKSLPSRERNEGPVGVYGSAGPVGSHDEALLEGPGIVVGRKGSIGAATWVDEPFWPIDTTYYVVPDPALDLRFCYYALNFRDLEALNRATGIPGLNRHDVGALPLLLPTLEEQQEIAAILSSVDDAIAATRKVIGQTRRVKKGLLQTLMTRGIGHTRFKQTEIGEIPEEWEVRTLTDVADVVDCKHRTPVYSDEGVPIVRPGDVGHGILDLSGCARVSESDYADLSEGRTADVGDLVYSRNQTFGLAGLVADDTPFALGQDTCLIKPNGIRSGFLHAVLESGLVWRQIHRVMGGSTFKRINLGDIRRFQLPIPSEKEQAQVESAITNVHRMSTLNAATVSALSTLKWGLMQDLLTGRVRVQPD